MFRIESVSFSIGNAFKEIGSTVKNIIILRRKSKQDIAPQDDEFEYSNSEPRSAEERTNSAIEKFNEANEERLIAEINRSGEIESVYDILLPEYCAYITPELDDLIPVSSDTVYASYRGKPVEIKFNTLDNGNTVQEIIFEDGSKIRYETFSTDGKMTINAEEFEMLSGTIIETKSANDRVFSQLIQTPYMQRKIIKKPEYLHKAEHMLTAMSNKTDPKTDLINHEDFLTLTNQKNHI